MDRRKGETREDVARKLGLGETSQARAFFNRFPRWVMLTGGGLVLLLIFLALRSFGGEAAAPFVTEEATRGALTVSVSATGSLEPVTTVDVGSEISGRLVSVNVDFNDEVRKGQLLARIDTVQLAANVAKAEANLAAARAAVLTSEATLRETTAKARRARNLAPGGSISREGLETAVADAARAVADLASARARVTVAEAELQSEKTTLGKAEITSPIDGVVISRDVDPGQTVAATFQTPKLFTLAEDLRRMQLQVDVDEADVGQVKVGQHATFTVDAYPNRRFEAQIESVRFAPQTKNGVVSYMAILTVDNSDLALRPGMTAIADIVTATRSDVLMVPNGALRFTPPGEKAPASITGKAGDIMKTVWTLDGRTPRPVAIRAGLTDGQQTEVLSGEIEPGMKLLVDVAGAAEKP